MIARFITQSDLDLYLAQGWRVTPYGQRGDVGECFVASFQCPRNPRNSQDARAGRCHAPKEGL